MKEANPKTIRLQDYRPPPYLIDAVELRFDLQEKGTRVESRLKLRRNPDVAESVDSLLLNGEGLTPVWIRLDGVELSTEHYQLEPDGLRLRQPPEHFELNTLVEISPERNTALEGLYRSGGMFCTQCEAEGFRHITWFLDRPDVMARFSVRIEADKSHYPVLLSNGNPGAHGDLEAGRHFAEWVDPIPKPSYLFALVAGDLRFVEDHHRTPSGKDVRLRIYVEPENVDKCAHAMMSLKHAMQWDERQYGREYDLDVFNIVAVNDFNMGAMENKGLNIFNAKYVLANSATATDSDFQNIEGIVAHEYFHNWTGNRITCRDWFQLSLKEGFTVFRDQEFSADMGSRGVKRIEDVRMLRAHQFAEDAGPMSHPVRPDAYIEINNFYTLTVYEKGAEVVRMLARLLGPERFRQATDLYFERHDGQAVTTDDFVRCMADVSGRDLSQFQHWYDFAGTPRVVVETAFDAERGEYSLTFRQSVPPTPGQRDKPAFLIPVALGLVGGDGQDLPLRLAGHQGETTTELVLELNEPEQRFVFEGVEQEPVPSLLRGFSAPVVVEYDYTDEALLFLMAHDSDGFNRWDAAQRLYTRVLLQLVEARRGHAPLVVGSDLTDALHSALQAPDADPLLLTELLTLPSEGYIGDQMDEVDVDGIHAAREHLRNAIARDLEAALIDRYCGSASQAAYRLDPASMGRRALSNLALQYLVRSGFQAARQWCIDQYRDADNMTDQLAALQIVADSTMPERDGILADFADCWGADPLVMDKWFMVQATADREGILGEIRALMAHPAFSMRNPNKVRAVIGSFAAANPSRFHAVDGTGYAFLTEQVLALDPLNPQIAARLLRGLARWRRYDAVRAALIREQLERVVATAGLSKDAYEVASRALADTD